MSHPTGDVGTSRRLGIATKDRAEALQELVGELHYHPDRRGRRRPNRGFVHVSDVVAANVAAVTTDHVGEAFNFGSGEETPGFELAETVRDVANNDVPIEHVDRSEGDIDRSCTGVSRARQKLGYDPTVSLEDGLRRCSSRTLNSAPRDSHRADRGDSSHDGLRTR